MVAVAAEACFKTNPVREGPTALQAVEQPPATLPVVAPAVALSNNKCNFECAAAGLAAYGACTAGCVKKFGTNRTAAGVACITAGCQPVVAAATKACLKTNPACKDDASYEDPAPAAPPVGVSGEKCDFECLAAGMAAYGTCTAGCVSKFGHNVSDVACITLGCPPAVAAATEACYKTNPACKPPSAVELVLLPAIVV